MGTRNHVYRHQFADALGGSGTGIGSRLTGRHVATDQGRYQAAADLLVADQLDTSGLDHGIGRLDQRYQPFCFNHA